MKGKRRLGKEIRQKGKEKKVKIKIRKNMEKSSKIYQIYKKNNARKTIQVKK